LWHGASVNFLIWGLAHGLVLIADKKVKTLIPKYLYGPIVFLITMMLWLPFRAENFTQLMELSSALFNPTSVLPTFAQFLGDYPLRRFIMLLIVLVVFVWFEWQLRLNDFNVWVSKLSTYKRRTIYYTISVLILAMGSFDAKPNFIYFQF
jgi:hypothetical protein